MKFKKMKTSEVNAEICQSKAQLWNINRLTANNLLSNDTGTIYLEGLNIDKFLWVKNSDQGWVRTPDLRRDRQKH